MIMYRPHRGGLAEAMLESKEFYTVEDMLDWICTKHNYGTPWFKITPEELNISDYGSDERVKWHNCYIVCFERPSKIKNFEGYCRYFGIKDDPSLPDDDREMAIVEDIPCGVIGMFTTDYDK